MVAATIVALLIVSLAAFLALWTLIEGETSNPTVMDREEAERRAIEQGGRETAENPANGDAADEPANDRDDVGWND